MRKPEWLAAGLCALLLVLMAGHSLCASALRRPLPQAEYPAPALAESGETAGAEQDRLDLNTATLEELTALPGIGEKRAQAILEWREEHGPFRYVEDLIQVSGVGEGTLAKLEDCVTVGGG